MKLSQKWKGTSRFTSENSDGLNTGSLDVNLSEEDDEKLNEGDLFEVVISPAKEKEKEAVKPVNKPS